MRHLIVRGVVAALFLVASAGAGPPDAPAPGPKAGSITALLPTANIVRGPAKQQVTTAAKKGDDVVWNDLVRTDKGGRARITLLDQSILSVGSQAELRIIKSDPKSQQTSVEVGYGRVRMEVTPITQQGGSFEIKTPTAVAGVIGTTIGADSSIDSTTFYCISGNSWVGNNASGGSTQPPSRAPAIAFRANGNASGTGVTSLNTTAFNTQVGDVVVVQIAISTPEVSAVVDIAGNTYSPQAGASSTLISPPISLVTYTTIATAANASNVVMVSFHGSVNAAVSASSYSGVAALGRTGSSTQSGANPTQSLTTQDANNWVVGGFAGYGTGAFTISTGNNRFNALAGGELGGAQADSKAASPATVTVAYTNSDPGWAMGIIELRSAARGAQQSVSGSASPPGGVPCPAGTVAFVAAGVPPVTRPATQQEMQQFTQDTEPAVISAMAPDSLAPGSVTDAVITGTQLSGISQLSSSNPSVTVGLNPGGTSTSVSVHVTVAANVAPGPATITLTKPTGPPSAAVFSIVSAGQAAQGQGPSIKALSVTVSPPAGGVVVTITGANFDANTQVKFGNVPASNVTFVSPTQLNVIVPPENAGTVDVTVVNGSGTSTLSGGFMFGGPMPAISPAGGVTVNPGVPVMLDGSGSSDTLSGATLSYSWLLCSPASLKAAPPVGTALSAASASTCTPAAGTAVGTDPQFSLNAPAAFGQYFVRLQVTDNLGTSAVMFVSVMVNQPNYLTDPVVCTLLFAQVFATLQSGSAGGGCGSAGAATVLGFFDPTYSGLTALEQTLQTVFPTYASMQVHLVGPQASTSGNLSTVTADWELVYTLKNDPACRNISPCQPPTYHASLGTVTTVWTLTPGQGLFVTNFRYPNGFPQGTPPAVPVLIVSSAPTNLAFTSPPQTLGVGVCSAALTVQSQNSSGNALNVGSTEVLTPTGPMGTSFFTDSGCTTPVTSSNLTIAAGANTASFFMTTSVTGSLMVTVTGSGAFTATATQTETAGTIIITSSQGNTVSANAVQLDGPLADALTLTATRSDNTTTGSVTLTFTGATIASTPSQLNSIPYATPEPVDFAATIDASGNVTTGPATVTVTPSNATPPAGPQATTLFFNIGDIILSGAPTCLPLTDEQTQPFTFTINAVSGFNIPTVNWQWSGFPAGVSVNQVNGMATLSGGTYTLPNFTLTSSISGAQTLDFDVTISNAQGSATKVFALNINLSTTACPAAAGRVGAAQFVTGTWTRGGFGGGMTRVVPGTGALPDLQLNAASLSFTPSIPKSGDTVDVRFRVTNVGKADAQHVPIALVVDGAVVASDTFDLRAGASTLAALEWANANVVSRSPQAAVVVDPNHTVPQASTLGKSAPLAHFAFLPVPGAQTVTQVSAAVQHATLEIADGGCAGFSFASGASSACGSGDVEITVDQLASGRFTLAAQNGIADLGTAFGGGKLAGVQYQPEVPAVAGHSYAVQLGGGKTGVLRLSAIRNPAQTSAQGRQAFGAGNVARNVGGASTGPVETGDVSGVRTRNQSKAYFEVSYQTQ